MVLNFNNVSWALIANGPLFLDGKGAMCSAIITRGCTMQLIKVC